MSALAAALLLGLASPAEAQVSRWAGEIAEASARFGIPETWIRRVMTAESGGQTARFGRPIVSRAGAMGLMQLMPETWLEMRSMHGLGGDPFAPRDNILAGTAYLRAMYDRFGYPGMFAAYNAGPKRYSYYLATGRPLPLETVDYVRKTAYGVMRTTDPVFRLTGQTSSLPLGQKARNGLSRATLFAVIRPALNDAPTSKVRADGLFAVRAER